ncbi:MAG TPA: hypothetical protein VM121_09250 [Acidimicrobiales bacterium]|nr:hypothetical protein [Acidimicrobiales bacterium]
MDERVGTTISDLARVATGFVVLGAQQAQVRRREIQKQLEPRLREAASFVGQAAEAVEERVDPAFGQIEEQLSGVTETFVREAKTATTEALRAVRRLASSHATEPEEPKPEPGDHTTEPEAQTTER